MKWLTSDAGSLPLSIILLATTTWGWFYGSLYSFGNLLSYFVIIIYDIKIGDFRYMCVDFI